MASLSDLTNAELIEWVANNIANDAAKSKITAAFEENDVTGSDLIEMRTSDDIKELGIIGLHARRIFKALETNFPNEFPYNPDRAAQIAAQQAEQARQEQARLQRERERAEEEARKKRASKANAAGTKIDDLLAKNRAKHKNRNNNNNNNNGNNNNNNNTYVVNNGQTYHVSIFVGSGRKKTKNTFTCQSTILDLKREIANNEVGGEAQDIRIAYKKKELSNDSQTLGQAGIVNDTCFVTVITRVHGGMAQFTSAEDEKNDNNNNNNKDSDNFVSKVKLVWNNPNADTRERIANFHDNSNIKPTLDQDCLTYDDDENELRVKMPCGHVFSPITIFKWCERTLNVYSKAQVCCPILECNKEWKIEDIVSGADLDEDEHASLHGILEHRRMMQSGEFKECPHCTGLVELPKELYMFRVRCNNNECKHKGDWCWICNKLWKGSGMAICGNDDCHTNYVNDILKIENCGTVKTIMSRDDVACPKLRACPRCLSIVEHKEACKHMKCWQCKRSFCFICLSLAGKDVNGYGSEWACEGGDSHAGKCPLAPVQVLS